MAPSGPYGLDSGDRGGPMIFCPPARYWVSIVFETGECETEPNTTALNQYLQLHCNILHYSICTGDEQMCFHKILLPWGLSD